MKIIEEREAWIHTHFIIDSYFITDQERREIKISTEPELMLMGIRYGLDFIIATSKHSAIIVLECIPFDNVKSVVKNLINETIKEFPVRHPDQRNVVTNISIPDEKSDIQNISDQVQEQ